MAAKKKPAGKAAAKPKAQEWTRNRTGKQPVGDCDWVEVRQRNGIAFTDMAGNLVWKRVGRGSSGDHCDIMVWRRVRKPRQPKAQPVTIEDLAREASKAGCAVRVSFDEPKPDLVMTNVQPIPHAELQRRSEQVRIDATEGADDPSLNARRLQFAEDDSSPLWGTKLFSVVILAAVVGAGLYWWFA